MAISREQKEQNVDQLAKDIEASQLTIASDYKGLTVAELEELRAQLKDQDGQFRVIKNTLIRVTAKNSSKSSNLGGDLLEGPTALTFGFGDEVSVAQVLSKYAKAHPSLTIKGGLMADGSFLSAEQINQLALLPTKDQLRGQFVGTIYAPVSSFVRALHANLSGLVNVLNNIKEAKV